jgi:hypothetical protein
MYTGTMIDELIGSVERAEAHAGGPSDNMLQLDASSTYRHEFTYDHEELLGVA